MVVMPTASPCVRTQSYAIGMSRWTHGKHNNADRLIPIGISDWLAVRIEKDKNMGREIRRVPPNWQHPKTERPNHRLGRMEECYQALYDRPYSQAIGEWIEQHQLWEAGKHPDQLDGSGKTHRYYAQWGGNAPSVEYCRPEWKPEEMTWWQVYETVSEGTPVTPPCETREELVEYLVANGDFWDQKRRLEGNSMMACEPWPRKQAESFIFGSGYAPSLVVTNGVVMGGVEALHGQTANAEVSEPGDRHAANTTGAQPPGSLH